MDDKRVGKSRKLTEALSSTRLTVFLCILLAVVSVVGTLVPQGAPPEEYKALYGQSVTRILGALGFLDLYRSAGFVLLLFLLALNLTTCTFKRFPNVWRSIRRPAPPPRESAFGDWRFQETFYLRGNPDEIAVELDLVLPQVFGKPAALPSQDPARRVERFERRRYSRLGPYIAHLSILAILLGGLIGALFGFDGFLPLREGEEASTVWLEDGGKKIDLGFRIRCNRFAIDTYPDGSPKEYRSEVTLADAKGDRIRDAAIRVNHPLSHEGVAFYQSTYGTVPDLNLVVEHRESGDRVEVRTELNKPFLLPGGQLERGIALDFREDLVIPAEMAKVTSFPHGALGPAVRIAVFDEKRVQDPFWILKDFPDLDRKRQSSYSFGLAAFRLIPYTGLQVAKDPGTWLVWVGCTFLVIGFFISLLLDHEIVWVTREGCGKDQVRMGIFGRGVRHPMGYATRFERRKALLRKRLARWLRKP